MKKLLFACAAMIGLGAGFAQAADGATDLRAELADLRAKIASMESAQMAATAPGGDCESLTSMKKNGAVKIGGDIEVIAMVVRRDERNGGDDEIDSTHFQTNDADLNFKITATPDSYLFIKLDLDDAWNGSQQDDLLEECYFMWEHVLGQPLAVKFGKAEVPFGMDKKIAFLYSYHHNGGNSFLTGIEPSDAPGNPHQAVGSTAHPEEVDNKFLVEGIYDWKNLLKFETAVFANARGMHEDRSDDTFFFQSYAARVTATPLEQLKVMASFMNMHNDSMGDEALSVVSGRLPGNGSDAEEDQQALSLAAEYKLNNAWQIFGEYSHGWNWNYDTDYSADIYQIGAVYGLTEAIDVFAIGEYMQISANNNDTLFGWDDTEDFYKAHLGAKYTFDSGIFCAVEYIHEWYSNNRPGDDTRESDGVAVGTGWYF